MDENYDPIKSQYQQIEESCYRMGIGVDEYYEIISKMDETVEEHLEKISRLEEMIEIDIGD
jgi:hypothetical protein